MDRKIWLDRVLTIVKELSSADYQDRVWVRGEGPEWSSYTEAICSLFDDLMFEDFVRKGSAEGILSHTEVCKCAEFISALDNFNSKLPVSPHPKYIVNHSDWTNIKELAVEVSGILGRLSM